MKRISHKLVQSWASWGTRFLPFADAASPELPLSRLLRLSLFQVSVGMALVLLVGTLNRVMIVELKVPAALVSIMVALPLLFAPLRACVLALRFARENASEPGQRARVCRDLHTPHRAH